MELSTVSFIRGVATQGRWNDGNFDPQYVTMYWVSYSENCLSFQAVSDSSGSRLVGDIYYMKCKKLIPTLASDFELFPKTN